MEQFLREKRTEVEQHLETALKPEPGFPESLREAMRYSLLAPGKRLRPILVLLAAEASQVPGANPWPAACAVEMVHVYSLIHDDLPAMDDDDLRRGQPTCHKKFGEALAILAGDALLTYAFQVLAEGYPGSAGAACCRDLARAAGAAGMVGGQVDDLAWERGSATRLGKNERGDGERTPTLAELEHLHARKTGALIQSCLRLGATAAHARLEGGGGAGPPAALLHQLEEYGRCLGLAFQIVDDLLDVEGHADQAGKRVNKDAARGKLTYPGLLGVAGSRARAQQLGVEARQHLAPLGAAGHRLLELVAFVLNRNH